MKRMLFNATFQEELRVATVDGQKLLDFDIETSSKTQRRGNIYKGFITRVEPSLEAFFVDYGTEKQGFLPFKEVDAASLPQHLRDTDLAKLPEGTTLIVQVEKDERGNKGAALTARVSLPGRYLVLMPISSRSGGISRRIEGDERDALKASLASLVVPQTMSVIARTAALGRAQEELQWDLNYLIKLWEAITNASNSHSGSFLIYQESNLVVRSIRDHFSPDISEILIDVEEVYEQAKQFISHVIPNYVDRVKLYTDDVPLFSRFQIEHQIESAYSRLVNLPSGGAIVIDHTEALTAIDVNSAKANKGSDIEATALATNLEAAEAIALQMRLRDLGGLVVVDFIDMENSKNQREVETYFKEKLFQDRARIQMGKLSRFGLLELSRQRLQSSLDESTTITCPRCQGVGTIRGIESNALHILRIIQEEAIKVSRLAALHVQLPVAIATYLLNEKREDVAKIEARMKTQIVLIPNVHLESPHYKIKKITGDSRDMFANNKSSYDLVEDPEDDLSTHLANKQKQDKRAVIRDFAPNMPAPVVANKSALNKLLGKLANMFKSSDSNTPNKHAATKGTKRNPKQQRSHHNKTRRNSATNKDSSRRGSNNNQRHHGNSENKGHRGGSTRNSNYRSNKNNTNSTSSHNHHQSNKLLDNNQANKAQTRPNSSNNTQQKQPSASTQQHASDKDMVKKVQTTQTQKETAPKQPVAENTITKPVDLGQLELVATSSTTTIPPVATATNTSTSAKRYNDVVAAKAQETSPSTTNVAYEMVETKP